MLYVIGQLFNTYLNKFHLLIFFEFFRNSRRRFCACFVLWFSTVTFIFEKPSNSFFEQTITNLFVLNLVQKK